ncbi:MAG: hypothetical protein COB08_018750 [Rhodobacteraceae bacterium]|nr:hypothetical protein [Paracoccaceae bacterium]
MTSKSEATIQLKIPAELKRRIQQTAFDRDETMKTFILKSIKKNGVAVDDSVVIDRRKMR